MENYGIIVNKEKDTKLKYARYLIQCIEKRGGRVNLVKDAAAELGIEFGLVNEKQVVESSDIIICLGGDGTFLRTARMAFAKDVPILGINLGTLGFLTEVDKNEIDSAIEKVFKKEYQIEERILLEAAVTNNLGEEVARDIALNDITITRPALSRILHLKMYVNGIFVDSFPGDGLIISTPTGSTAYSMSAGGPIVEPDMDLMIMTPICPHILYSRSFVINGNSWINVVVEGDSINNTMVTFDGQKGCRASGGYSIRICKSASTIKLMRMSTRNFFNVLRTKIYDRGEKLAKDEI